MPGIDFFGMLLIAAVVFFSSVCLAFKFPRKYPIDFTTDLWYNYT